MCLIVVLSYCNVSSLPFCENRWPLLNILDGCKVLQWLRLLLSLFLSGRSSVSWHKSSLPERKPGDLRRIYRNPSQKQLKVCFLPVCLISRLRLLVCLSPEHFFSCSKWSFSRSTWGNRAIPIWFCAFLCFHNGSHVWLVGFQGAAWEDVLSPRPEPSTGQTSQASPSSGYCHRSVRILFQTVISPTLPIQTNTNCTVLTFCIQFSLNVAHCGRILQLDDIGVERWGVVERCFPVFLSAGVFK